MCSMCWRPTRARAGPSRSCRRRPRCSWRRQRRASRSARRSPSCVPKACCRNRVTVGTAQVLRRNGVDAEVVGKFSDGPDNVVEKILAGEVDIVLNTPWGNSGPRVDGYEIRTAAVAAGIPCLTTVQAAAAAVQGIEELARGEINVRSLQDLHKSLAAWRAGD